ncbi:hypothetical protein BD626DRAFT_576171 [Schizophyllum amplum]|uniref:Uncharacterized protein n=1 Tax=Schizophyllum amplum TaxID=97359 RepID=A0A550BTZ5_9AGAR|nr:hypothetical protein BD626DRAFT_576171 [Auriculariopsis ampla]
MCEMCTSKACPVYELQKKVIMLGMTYGELVRACEEEEELWKKASAKIVMLKKSRTRWGDIYTDMFNEGDNTEKKVEEAMRAEGALEESEEEELSTAAEGIDRVESKGEDVQRDS